MSAEKFINFILPPVGTAYSAYTVRKKYKHGQLMQTERSQKIAELNYEIQRNAAILIGIQTGICGIFMGLHNVDPVFDKFFTLNHLKHTPFHIFAKASGIKDLDGMMLSGFLAFIALPWIIKTVVRYVTPSREKYRELYSDSLTGISTKDELLRLKAAYAECDKDIRFILSKAYDYLKKSTTPQTPKLLAALEIIEPFIKKNESLDVQALIKEIKDNKEFAHFDDFWEFIYLAYAEECNLRKIVKYNLIDKLEGLHRRIAQCESLIAPGLLKFSLFGDTGLDPKPLFPDISEEEEDHKRIEEKIEKNDEELDEEEDEELDEEESDEEEDQGLGIGGQISPPRSLSF